MYTVYFAVLAVDNSLPDLAGHSDHFSASRDAAVTNVNDGLAWLRRHFEAGRVPVGEQFVGFGRAGMLG